MPIYGDLYQNLQWGLTFNLKVVTHLKSASEATVQIANEFPIFAGLVRDSCESNACEINAYSFANTRTFREVLHMNQSETRGPRTG